MQLQRIGELGAERPVAVHNGQVRDLSGLTADIDGEFLASGGIAAVRERFDSLPEIDIAGQRIGAPLARPQAVWCVGMNYAAHAAESGAEPPKVPVLFFKTPNTVIGPDDEVLIPRGSVKTDWEVELAIVIGKRAAYLESVQDAWDHIAGYAVSNDVSERAFQLEQSGGQWSKGKCCATFNPLGPSLVPADEVDPGNLRLQSWVNGEPRQDSSTADMIFDVPTIVHHLSQYAVLEPGDVINTGTPQGVALSGRFPYLKAGDVMEVEISGLGRARQVCGQA
ncbi:fumarylacetoacetate hydrolase family protein [Nakamurella aerolata]|uniref:Fumarylacetoacetate hydrolase family protein n=1 Tax=Nakamurella aerolata TaxID=1656892 RepID=A0A849A618_9ACTN|nr:fumarylacetoacetate hydrolase family protein [Nakamurella aerolata]